MIIGRTLSRWPASGFLIAALLAISIPSSAQIDRVAEQQLLILGTGHPLVVDLSSNQPSAYRLTFSTADARAFRAIKLGYDGRMHLVTPTPRRLGAGGKISVTIRLEGMPKPWRINMLVSLGKAISATRQNNAGHPDTFLLVHTNEAQYLLRPSQNAAPHIIEILGLSHLPTGSLLAVPPEGKPTQFKPTSMINLLSKSGALERVYVRRIH